MKIKRAVAWLLVCALQLCACLVIPLHGRMLEQKLEQNGEHFRFAVRCANRVWDERRPSVNIDLPQPLQDDIPSDETRVRVLETGKDGLTRVREIGVKSTDPNKNLGPGDFPDVPLYSVWGQEAALLASDSIFRDLDTLTMLMDDLVTALTRRWQEGLSAADRTVLEAKADTIQNDALRALAKKQIGAENGNELFDSWVTGILYQGEIFLQDVYVAEIHVASIYN